MVDVATLALEARTDGLKRAEAALDGVTNAAVRTETATERVTAAADQQSAAMGRVAVQSRMAGGGFQNLGFQVQDLAVQIGAGTSATQALGQQLPQLLSGFGGLGIAIGTASAVLIPLVGHFINGASGARDFTTTLQALEDQLADTADLAEIAAGDFDALIERFGALTPAVQSLVAVQAEISLREMSDAVKSLNGELTAMYDGNAWLNVSRAEDLSNGLNLNTQAARELAFAMGELGRADTLDDQLALVTAMRERFIETVGPIGQMSSAQFQFYQRLVDSESALRATKQRAEELAGAGQRVAVAISPIPGILNSARDAAGAAAGAVGAIGNAAAGAVGQVRSLAAAMWDAAQARISAAKWVEGQQPGGMGDLANQYKLYGQGKAAADKAAQGTLQFSGVAIPDIPTGSGAGAGGGGGGAADDGFQSRLDALMEGLQTERDTVDEWYQESMSILNDRRAQELLGAQGHADALVAIEEELQRRKVELRDQDLGHYQSFFGAMAGALQSGGSKMLAISKGFALAEAAVSMWRGAAKALELPFPASLAAWGQVLATGARAISGIKSASFGGGSIGGGSIGSTTAAPVATPDRNIRVNIQGDGMFADALRGSIRQIAEALGDERDIGGFVVA